MLKLKIFIVKISRRIIKNYVPREVIFCIDAIIAFIAAQSAYFLVGSIQPISLRILNLSFAFWTFWGIQLISFMIFKSYSGIIRYTGFRDAFRQIQTTSFTVIVVLFINQITITSLGKKIIYDGGAIIYGFIAFSLLYFFRIVIKRVYQAINANRSPIYAYVLGTELTDVAIAEGLLSDPQKKFNLIGFITEYNKLKRNKIFTLPVKSIDQLDQVNCRNKALIVSERRLKNITATNKKLIDKLLDLNLKIYKLPEIEDWNRENISAEIKQVKLEDLLHRSPIKLHDTELRRNYAGRVILVTGAAGTIGGEIVRQLIEYEPKTILLVDQAETPLHEMELELNKDFPELDFRVIVADVTNQKRVESIYEAFNPNVVFHGAAYKHVPMMEKNPSEALSVNVCGTKNMALLAVKFNVEKFVFVSTDKAVNPTNIMGASKRAAEMLIQSLSQKDDVKTNFITTRFGNVLGSNGSVIPHFKKQIKNGGPVTVTHEAITRYFMTIDEACQLVLEAGIMGKGGEIYVFDMGQPVKILDLAKKMIRLSGFVPEKEIKIEFTGLRPGEKLYEELLADKENTLQTYHEKILIAKSSYQFDNSNRILLNNLFEQIHDNEDERSLKTLKQLVPEYKKEKVSIKSDKAEAK